MAKYGHPSDPNVSASVVNLSEVDNAIEYLSGCGNFTLVLGAGTSIHYDMPDWNGLLFELYKTTRKGKVSDENIRLEYEILKSSNDNMSLAQYIVDDPTLNDIESLRSTLYESFDLSKLEISPLHDEIIKLIVRGKTINIISYNFDGLLEYFFDKNDIPYNLSYGNILKHRSGAINIYHVHGYLPLTGPISDDIILTFSESQYIAQYNNIYSWQNQVQLLNYTNYPCIFIGLSFSDPNMKKLLTTKVKLEGLRHFRIEKPFDNIQLYKFKDNYMSGLKLETSAVPLSIDLINDSKFEQCKKLGVELLNFNEFDEFPHFISRIN